MARLTFNDGSSHTVSGTFTGVDDSPAQMAAVWIYGAGTSATITGGSFQGGVASTSASISGQAVDVGLGASLTIADGTFVASAGTLGSALFANYADTITINGGTYSGNAGAILSTRGDISVTAGTFTATAWEALRVDAVDSPITVTISGGVFTTSGVSGQGYALGVSFINDSTFNMTGGSLEGDVRISSSAGGTLTISGGSISGAVDAFLAGGSTLTISGSAISGKVTLTMPSDSARCTFTGSGLVWTDNTASGTLADNTPWIEGTLAGTLGDGSPVSVTVRQIHASALSVGSTAVVFH